MQLNLLPLRRVPFKVGLQSLNAPDQDLLAPPHIVDLLLDSLVLARHAQNQAFQHLFDASLLIPHLFKPLFKYGSLVRSDAFFDRLSQLGIGEGLEAMLFESPFGKLYEGLGLPLLVSEGYSVAVQLVEPHDGGRLLHKPHGFLVPANQVLPCLALSLSHIDLVPEAPLLEFALVNQFENLKMSLAPGESGELIVHVLYLLGQDPTPLIDRSNASLLIPAHAPG